MIAEVKTQRLVYGETLVELGGENPAVVVLDADVSNSTQTRLFAQAFPERFFNVGIAEANMVSMAAGLASCGYVPFVNTFALFMALRAGDQVRANVAATGLSVKMAGGYAGLSDHADGASHQSVEDIAVMRAIPGITVLVPSDIVETRQATLAAAAHPGPVFLRLSRESVSRDYGADHPFSIGKAITLVDGDDLCFVAAGPVLKRVCQVADMLSREGIQARVIDMHTIKPLDIDAVEQAARDCGAIVTVEEHTVLGGLGSAVAEAVCERYPVPVLRCGVPDKFGESGNYDEILERAGLDTGSIARTAKRAREMK